ncbi:MAG: DUF417 family protein [Sphingomonadales bacterium]|nr:MAG: DUF417 family protein [Sphingomonadales bacterium]
MSEHSIGTLGERIRNIGGLALPLALGIVFLWFGGMKFTAYEANGIAPFIANSPFVGWWHTLLGIQGASYMLGVVEILAGLLLLGGLVLPLLGVAGGALGIVTYVTTLSFFLTTPGVAEPTAGGFPAISAGIGQFLLKDVVLLAASIWILGNSLIRHGR